MLFIGPLAGGERCPTGELIPSDCLCRLDVRLTTLSGEPVADAADVFCEELRLSIVAVAVVIVVPQQVQPDDQKARKSPGTALVSRQDEIDGERENKGDHNPGGVLPDEPHAVNKHTTANAALTPSGEPVADSADVSGEQHSRSSSRPGGGLRAPG